MNTREFLAVRPGRARGKNTGFPGYRIFFRPFTCRNRNRESTEGKIPVYGRQMRDHGVMLPGLSPRLSERSKVGIVIVTFPLPIATGFSEQQLNESVAGR